MKKVVFFGSSHFSVPVLHSLVQHSSFNIQHSVTAVVTTPPKPSGRGLKLSQNIVQIEAENYGIQVFTNIQDFLHSTFFIQHSNPIGLVAAYGRIIGPKTLEHFGGHIYGLHPSLLPAYRGPSPLQQQILDGVTDTGVTLYQLDTGQDTGPIVTQDQDVIHPDDTQISLGNRLFLKGVDLFLNSQTNGSILAINNSQFTRQDSSLATFTKKISRQDGFIPWEEFNQSLAVNNWPLAIEKKLRAFFPWPGVWSMNPEGKRIKLISVKPKVVVQEESHKPTTSPHDSSL